jgi:adhesin/invasin
MNLTILRWTNLRALLTAVALAVSGAACTVDEVGLIPCNDNANCPPDYPTCSTHAAGAAGKCVAGAAVSKLELASGQDQTTIVATAASAPFSVLVTDTNGNPFQGTTITWAVTSGGGTITPTGGSGLTNTTGPDGIATAVAVAGNTTGANTFTATATGVTGSPVTFNLAGTAGPAATFKVVFPLTNVPAVAAQATVSAFDSLSNPTSYTGTVKVTVGQADTNAVLPSNFALTIPLAGTGKVTGIALAKVTTAQTVTITDTTKASLTGSQAGITVGPAVSIAGSAAIPPLGSLHLTASGGSGTGYVWSLAAGGSGGSVNPSSGLFTAGVLGNKTDTITVTDSVQNSASVTVSVGGGVAITCVNTINPKATATCTASGGSGTGYVWSLATNASGGAIVPGTGVYTAGAVGTTTDKVKVTDSLGNVATVDIAVNPGITVTGPASGGVTPKGTFAFTASGGSGAGYTWSLTANPSGGSIDPSTGAYSAGLLGAVTDLVKVVDNLGNVGTASVNVGPVVAIVGAATTPPKGSITFTANGGTGTGFVWSLTASPSGGNIGTNTGLYTAGPVGSVTDKVKVVDSLGNIATLNVSVTGVIAITGGNTTSFPRGTINFASTGGSATGLVWTLTANPSGATIVAATGIYTAGINGSVTDVVKVVDSLGNFASANVVVGPVITIAGNNGAPPRGAINFTASGGSGSNYVWSLTANPSGGTIDSGTGAYVAGGSPDVTDSIKVVDSLGNFATKNIAVGSGIIISGASTTPPKGSLTFTASQGSGTGFTWSMVTANSGGSIAAATGVYTAGPTPSVTDTIKVTDSLGSSATKDINVTAGITIAPYASSFPKQSHTFTASGGSNAGFTWSITTNGSGGTIGASTGLYVAGATGNTNDTIKVVDNLNNTASVTVAVSAGVSVSGGSANAFPKQSLNFTAAGGSGTGFAWSVAPNNSGATIGSGTGVYVAGALGNKVDTVVLVDSLGNTASQTVNVSAAVSIAGTATAFPKQSRTFTASGGSGTGFTWSMQSNPSGGVIDSVTGIYVAGAVGSVNDVVKVVDSVSNSATLTVAVSAVVVIGATTTQVAPLGALTFTISGGSGTGYVWALTTNASGGTINSTNGNYTAGVVGSVTDVITVTDSATNTATVSITVTSGVTISGSGVVPPRGSKTYTASGGGGQPFTWTFNPGGNLSGGTITAAGGGGANGNYVAGATPNVVDVIKVTDKNGGTSTLNVQVGPGITISGTATAFPKQSRTFTAAGGSGTGFSWSILTNNSNGSIVASTGVYTAGATGNVTDTIKVVDSLTNSATLDIAVSAAITISGATTTFPKEPHTYTAAGGSNLNFTWAFVAAQNKSGGSINGSTGAYIAGATPNVTDQLQVTDSVGNTATISIVVGGGVVIGNLGGSVPKASRTLTATGGSGTGFSWSFATNNSGATIGTTTGVYTAGATGSVTDTVQLTDSLGNTTTATIAVSAGVSITGNTTTAPRATKTLNAQGGSSSGYTWSVTVNNSGSSIATASSTTATFTAGNTGNVTDTVQLADSLGNTVTATVVISAGVSIGGAAPTAPKGTKTLTATGGSATGFTWTLSVNNSGGSVGASGASVTYTAGSVGSVSDTVQVTDSLGNTATASISVTAGVTIGGSGSTFPKAARTLTATGGSGAGFTWSISNNNSGGTIGASGASVTYTAGPTGSVVDTVTVTDGNGNTANTTVTITAGVSIAGNTSTTPKGTITFLASGGSGSTYVWSMQSAPSGGTVTGSGTQGSTGTYVAGATGSVTDVVKVVDSLANQATVSINLSAAMAIVPAAGSTTFPKGTLTFGSSGGTQTGITWSMQTNNSGGNIGASTGNYTAGTTGGVTDTIKVVDSLLNQATQNIAVTAGVTITGLATVPPRGSKQLAVSGGSNSGFLWAMQTCNSGTGCTVSGTGLYTAGQTPSVTDVVQVTDSVGNVGTANITVGPGVSIAGSNTVASTGQIVFTASNGSGTGFVWSMQTSGSGSPTVVGSGVNNATGTYTAGNTAPSTDVVRVADSLGNSATISISVTIGAASPATSTITAPVTVVSGASITATLQAKDAGGNSLTVGGSTVVFSIQAGTGTATVGATTSLGNGSYTASVTGVLAGTVTVKATLGGVSVTSTAAVTVTVGAASAAASTITAPATVVSGANITATLQAKDAAGNLLSTGGSTVVFSIQNGTGSATVGATTDVGNGTYTAAVTGVLKGTVTVKATLGGTSVTSTAAVTVNPGAATTAQSTVTSAATVNSGSTITATLTAKDAAGNTLTTGGSTVVLSVSNGTGTATIGATTDVGNGTYTAVVTGVLTGSITIQATLGGSAVTSTSAVTVNPGAISTATSTITAAATVVSGSGITATLTAKDAAGNLLTSGGSTVVFSVQSGAPGTATASATTDVGNGTYTAVITGVLVGTGTIKATIGGSAVTSTSALSITIGPASTATSTVTAPASVVSGANITATVQLKDAAGNSYTTGGATVVFSIQAGTGTATVGGTTDAGNGSYTAVVTGVLKGTVTVKATVGGSNITSTAAVTVNPGAATTANSTVSAAATVASGSTITATLQAKDSNGNSLTTGGLTVVLSVANGTGTATIGSTTDVGNGTYTATITGVLAGTVTVQATIGGSAVTSTASVTVTPGAASTATSVLSAAASVASGATITATLQAKDAAGNSLTAGGATVVISAQAGTGTANVAATTDVGNGTYTAVVTGAAAGTVTLKATIGGSNVTSTSALTVTVGALAKFAVSGFASPAAPGAVGDLTVTAQDFGSNTVTSYTGTVTFSSNDASAVFTPPTYTFLAGDNGVKSFTGLAKLVTTASASATIVATDTGKTGQQSGITVLPATANTTAVRIGATATMIATGGPTCAGKVLIVGGGTTFTSGACGGTLTATAELYDPATGTSASAGSMTVPRCQHTATLLGTTIYFAGGANNTKLDEYNTSTCAFNGTPAKNLVAKRTRHTATVVSSKIYFIGGLVPTGVTGAGNKLGVNSGTGDTNNVEVFDGTSSTEYTNDAVGSAGDKTGRSDHTAVYLAANSRIVLFGGTGETSYETFNPSSATNSNSAVGTGSATNTIVRSGHAAIARADGTLLLVGGVNATGTAINSVQLYDPTGPVLNTMTSLNTARGYISAVLLANGNVMVVGGTGTGPDTVEVYNPASTGTLVTGTSPIALQGATRRDASSAVLLPGLATASSSVVLVTGGSTSNTKGSELVAY